MARALTRRSARGLIFDLLTFERPMTGPMTHLLYWGGLAVVLLISFGVVGGAVGMLLRGGPLEGVLLSLPVLVGGLILCTVLAILWRGACEFYLAVFRIADDLNALRAALEREEQAEARRQAAAAAARAPAPRLADPVVPQAAEG